MTERITRRNLDALCARLNAITNSPARPWSADSIPARANIGNFHIDNAYGGWDLHRMMNDAGGVTCPLNGGHRPARELYDAIYAYIRGVELGLELARAGVTA